MTFGKSQKAKKKQLKFTISQKQGKGKLPAENTDI